MHIEEGQRIGREAEATVLHPRRAGLGAGAHQLHGGMAETGVSVGEFAPPSASFSSGNSTSGKLREASSDTIFQGRHYRRTIREEVLETGSNEEAEAAQSKHKEGEGAA